MVSGGLRVKGRYRDSKSLCRPFFRFGAEEMQTRTASEWAEWEKHQTHTDPFQVDGGMMLKTRPATEGRRRYVYTEPSSEDWDAEEETTYQKALSRSAEHFLRFGNIDIMHITLFGLKLNIPNWHEYEIGRPLEVVADGKRYRVDEANTLPGHPPIILMEEVPQFAKSPVWVKAEIYQGTGPSAAQANYFWDSVENKTPPTTWYPSVGGTQPKKADVAVECPSCGHHLLGHRKAILEVQWSNIAFAKEPINRSVRPVNLVPPAEFAKAVLAGHTVDISGGQLTGGGALRVQSRERGRKRLLRSTIEDEDYAKAEFAYLNNVGTGQCPHHPRGCPVLASAPTSIEDVVRYFRECEGRDEIMAKTFALRLFQGAADAINHRRSGRAA